MHETVVFDFSGQFRPQSFAEFVTHRAGRLALDAHIRSGSDRHFEVEVTGQPDLVDAFEMACSLGPIDCLVLDLVRNVRGPQ